MSNIPDEYTPSETEIDEVMSLYNNWLEQEYLNHGDRDIAIGVATERAQDDLQVGTVFHWVANNDAALIYDVDETLKDDMIKE